MYAIITVTKKDNKWIFTGMLDNNDTPSQKLLKVQLENGVVLFEGNPLSGIEWLKKFLSL